MSIVDEEISIKSSSVDSESLEQHIQCNTCGRCFLGRVPGKEEISVLPVGSSVFFGPCLMETLIYLLDLLPFRIAYRLGILHENIPLSTATNKTIIVEDNIEKKNSTVALSEQTCQVCHRETCILKNELVNEEAILNHEIEYIFDKLSENFDNNELHCKSDITEHLIHVLSKILGGRLIIRK